MLCTCWWIKITLATLNVEKLAEFPRSIEIFRDTKIMTNFENTIRIIEKMRKSQKLPLVIMLYLAVVVNAAEKLQQFFGCGELGD